MEDSGKELTHKNKEQNIKPQYWSHMHTKKPANNLHRI